MEQQIFSQKSSDLSNTIKQLKRRNNPVYIYGKDATAMRVYKSLTDNGISIKGFFVDDKYFTKEQEAIPVYRFSEISSLSRVDIVIGFYQFGLAYQKISQGLLSFADEIYFVNPEPLFDYNYYLENKDLFEETYDLLKDSLSKETMAAYMDGRMNGVMRPLYHCYTPNQYFIPEVKLGKNEIFMDCGMYDGDTIVEFMSRCDGFDTIIGFEPDMENINKFNQRNLEGNIKVINKGVWSKDDILCFKSEGTTASKFSDDGDIKIHVTSIDSLQLERPVTFIKMDIEGSELEALHGAKNTIIRDCPTLAICVYHKKEDLITIPQFIKSIAPDNCNYTFYLRHHSLYEHETVLYAIPSEK